MRVTMKLEGFRETAQALDDLKPLVAKRIARKALMKLLQPVADMARSLCPVESPNVNTPRAIQLRDTIGVGTSLTKRQRKQNKPLAKLEVYVGPGAISKGGRGAARHAHLVEFGTHERTQRRTGRRTGTMPRHPYMRPAWDAQQANVFSNLANLIKDELAAHVQRVAKKAAKAAK